MITNEALTRRTIGILTTGGLVVISSRHAAARKERVINPGPLQCGSIGLNSAIPETTKIIGNQLRIIKRNDVVSRYLTDLSFQRATKIKTELTGLLYNSCPPS